MGWQWKVEFNGRTVRSSVQHRLVFLGNDTCWHREVKPTLTVTWCWIGSRYMMNVSTVLQFRSLSPAVGPDRSILCLTCLVYIHQTCSGLWWSVTTLQQLVNTKPKPFATRWFSPSSPGSNILLSSPLCPASLLSAPTASPDPAAGCGWCLAQMVILWKEVSSTCTTLLLVQLAWAFITSCCTRFHKFPV